MLPTGNFPTSPSNLSLNGQNGKSTIYRHQSPEPASIYYQQKKQIKPEVQYLSQVSGILQGTPSLSFGQTQNSLFKANINQNNAKTANNQGTYRGQLNQDKKPHGYGTYIYVKQKYEYTGLFQNGKQHGRGILSKIGDYGNKLTVYQGQWRNGMKNGKGKYLYNQNNHYYQGIWVDDQRHGTGIYVGPIGTYSGQWQKGKMTGKGQLTVRNTNTKYIGRFQNNQFCQGKMIYSNGDIYQGNTINGLRHDSDGKYTYPKSSYQKTIFIGNWQKDLKHDNQIYINNVNNQKDKRKQLTKGTVTYSNGQILKGSWDRNKFRFGQACSYKWVDGDILNGWLKQSINGGYTITGIITRPDGTQYQVR